MKYSKIFVFIYFGLLTLSSSAQVDRYMVHFTDKDNSPFTIGAPLDFLSQRALDRRTNQSINLSSDDLPVSPAYLDSINDMGIHAFFTSKWFNAALVQITDSQKTVLLGKSYVSDVEYVGPGDQLTIGNTNLDFSGDEIIATNNANLSTEGQNKMIGVDKMHADEYKGEGILIAVFDGGFTNVNRISAFNHLRADNRIVYTYDFPHNEVDPYSYSNHGTMVFSALAAVFGDYFTGSAPAADYILCVTEDDASFQSEHRIEEYNWAFAAEMADSAGVDIISGSVGYYEFEDSSMDYEKSDLDGNTAVISKAASMASARGILVVVSAGNEGNKPWELISMPADAANVIAVGSVTADKVRSGFSSIGPTSDNRIKPDLVAQGGSTVMIGTAGNVRTSSGTSFSTPIVAGMAAGLWQANPTLTNLEVIERLTSTASMSTSPDNLLGYGIPNFVTANGGSILGAKLQTKNSIRIYPNPISSSEFYIESDKRFSNEQYEVVLYSITGRKIPFEVYQISESKMRIIFSAFKGAYITVISGSTESYSFKLLK